MAITLTGKAAMRRDIITVIESKKYFPFHHLLGWAEAYYKALESPAAQEIFKEKLTALIVDFDSQKELLSKREYLQKQINQIDDTLKNLDD